MEITLNSETKTIQSESLSVLINDMLGEKTKGIAVAINQNVIPKTDWDKTLLKANDNVLIIKATQGG